MVDKLDRPRVLLTGAGSSIGFGMAKALRGYRGLGDIVLANPTKDFAARALFDRFIPTPDFYFARRASATDYAEFLLETVQSLDIRLVLVASIFELPVVADLASRLESAGCVAITETPETIATFSDKLGTAETLRRLGIPCPATEEILVEGGRSVMPTMPLPLLIKPRFGYGSKGVAVISNEQEFLTWDRQKEDKRAPFVAQEYLPDADLEYSCIVTSFSDGAPKGCMAIRRNVVRGVTLAATYGGDCSAIEDAIVAHAAILRPRFCLNFQGRVFEGKLSTFEINPRFGAAEPIRAALGFDALRSVLEERVDMARQEPPTRLIGTVYREHSEFFVPVTAARGDS